jgi:hypothetical protein
MRRSRFTENEILHLLYEASTSVSVAEICSTAGVSLRTFYRWRRRFGGLNAPAVVKMKELAGENLRLQVWSGISSNVCGIHAKTARRHRLRRRLLRPATTRSASKNRQAG